MSWLEVLSFVAWIVAACGLLFLGHVIGRSDSWWDSDSDSGSGSCSDWDDDC